MIYSNYNDKGLGSKFSKSGSNSQINTINAFTMQLEETSVKNNDVQIWIFNIDQTIDY